MTNFQSIYDQAQQEADKLSKEMDGIFEPYKGELEAPEFMPDEDRNKWDMLHRIRTGVFNRMQKMENAAIELNQYIIMEVA